MAQYNDELLLAEEDSNSVFGDYLSDTESEQEKCEVNVRRGNKGKQIEYPHHHHCRHKSCTDGEVFLDSQVNNNSTYVYGSSPSTSSTPVRYRSRNSSVRSIQTVDCCMPSAERDGIVFRNELFSQDRDFDSSSDEDDAFIRSHKPEAPLHPIDEEMVEEGLNLYLQFLRGEIESNRLESPTYLEERIARAHPRNLEALRTLADQFALSPQRASVRRQAEMVPLERLDFISFTELLLGLFQEGGVTWERVIVLFFFCSDLSIRALQESLMRTFQHITEWATTFITDNFSRWIALTGGWSVIFRTPQVPRYTILGMCCVGIIAICIFIRNSNKV